MVDASLRATILDNLKSLAQEFGVSSSQLQAAQKTCAHVLSATGGSIQQCETTGDCPQVLVQQALNVMRKYARCMRAHGVPNWPDPIIDSEGRPLFDVSNAVTLSLLSWRTNASRRSFVLRPLASAVAALDLILLNAAAASRNLPQIFATAAGRRST